MLFIRNTLTDENAFIIKMFVLLLSNSQHVREKSVAIFIKPTLLYWTSIMKVV